MARITGAGLLVVVAFWSVSGAAADRCAALDGTAFSGARVLKAQDVPADPTKGSPAHCEVTVQGSSGAGSKITMVYRLPNDWNGKMLGLGSGGWAGNTTLTSPRPTATTAMVGLPRGYATAQSDAGHPEPPVLNISTVSDVTWVRGNPVAVADFGNLAVHETAVLGKQLIAAYYGRPVERSYFFGCSTGGRMGMMETQRYPDDYEGVIAGAPVYTLQVQTSATVRSRFFQAPGAAINEELLAKVNAAVLAACDAKDGQVDGVITDPRHCDWDPGKMRCTAGAAANSCLAPAQVNALRQVYATQRTRSGIVGNHGLSRGSELAWNPNVLTAGGERTSRNGALGDLIPLMFNDPKFDLATFDIERHQAAVHKTAFAGEYDAGSTDLSRYFARGGKLIFWHGLNDSGPSPYATQDYYERAVARNGGGSLRYFAAPGVNHCGEGAGADKFDLLTVLEDWVEKGAAPEQLVAVNPRKGFERPLCAWPKLPAYVGGDPNSAASFACR